MTAGDGVPLLGIRLIGLFIPHDVPRELHATGTAVASARAHLAGAPRREIRPAGPAEG